jgi:hypothetical protein
MAYQNRFNCVDLLINQLTPLVQPGTDPLLLSAMAGIIAVEAVTAYELAVKDIFEEFSHKKNIVFGSFVKSSFSRLNGRIKYQEIKENMVKAFGEKYVKRFVQKKDAKTAIVLTNEHVDLVQTYDNLVLGRHKFVHAGVLTLTLQEAVKNYKIGKELIAALDEAMKR